MKYLIILFFVASCSSNELSDSDKAFLETKISLHNIDLQYQYNIDSLRGIKQPTVDGIWFDRNLTLEKYLDYCKRTKTDPIKFIDAVTASR